MAESIDSFLRRCALLLLAAAVLVGCGDASKPAPPVAQDFLTRHWVDPLPPQGAPPTSFSALEASLSPDSCGQCHAEQFKAWRTSLHSKAVGAGLLWQLMLMNQDQGNRCLRCHAPLAEQKALLALELGWPNAPKQAPPEYVSADLAHRGLVCAACHIREHRRYGPPARGRVVSGGVAADGAHVASATSAPSPDGTDRSTNNPYAPHGGFTIAPAFQDSRFCAHCHQFPDDGPRIAGKLQEDTYQQWLASAYAQEGPGKRTCQGCHMPDRQHVWRGIHDPKMTRSALDIELQLIDLGEGRHEARGTLRNSGAGHHFPTYMVPKVEVQFVRIDARGGAQLLASHIIGWQVDTGITREIADTRLAAGETREYRQTVQAPASGDWRVEMILRVAPAEHYERIYSDSLTRVSQFPAAVEPVLRRALREARATRYELARIVARPQSRATATIAN